MHTLAVGGSEHQTSLPSCVPSTEKRSVKGPAAASTTPSAKRTSLKRELTLRTLPEGEGEEAEGEASGALPQRRSESAEDALARLAGFGLELASAAPAAAVPPVQEVLRRQE